MEIEFNEEIMVNGSHNWVQLWARCGTTRIRCDIGNDVISDYFHNNPLSGKDRLISLVYNNFRIIEQALVYSPNSTMSPT